MNGVERGKTCGRPLSCELSSRGKAVTSVKGNAKGGKTSNRCQAWGNYGLEKSYWCEERDNMKAIPSTGITYFRSTWSTKT